MGSGDKAKGDGDKPARSPAQAEALALIANLEKEIDRLAAFVAEEKKAAKRKAPSPKRMARLRLVSDDIGSASNLSTKSVKG
ncbi:MAG: hypothetical protein HYX32_03860 [Actinobacteria bacterium]|nr:hypothetical protein [Actinomycetota bacterium]